MLSSEFQPCDVMDSKHQSLFPPFPCTTANGSRGLKQPSSSPETGVARPKPPVKPKPCVLPKPAMPAKPAPGQRPALSEVPSAEKINLLAGPKPYSSGAGNAVKRLSFGLRCPPRDATNGKEASSTFPPATKPSEGSEGTGPEKKFSVVEDASREECGESSSIRKGTVPFKVKPVPVAAKPERFPGTTVEEILAKIEKPNKEGVNSPDRPRLVRSFFSLDGGTAVHLGPKGYTAFRRCSSGGEGGESELEGPACHSSHEAEESTLARTKEDITSSNGQHILESEQLRRTPERDLNFLSGDSSGQRSMSCDGGQPGRSSPQSPPGASFPQIYQPLAELSSEIAPGSPDAPAQPVQLPSSPYYSANVPNTNVNLPPGSPDAPTQRLGSPVQIPLDLAQAPGSPVALADHWPPGSPTTPIKTFLGHTPGLASPSARCPEAAPLPEPSSSVAPATPTEHSLEHPSCPLGVFESPGSPSTRSEYCLASDQPPGSPSHVQDPLLFRDQDPHQNHTQTFPSEDKGPQHSQLALRRASEGVVQSQSKGMIREELGGSLAVLLKGEGRPLEQTAGGESSWSLSQSFEWSFPNRPYDWGGKRLGSPPRSPIKEAEDTGSLETELGEDSPSSKVSYEERNSDRLDRKGEEVEPNEKSPFPGESSDSLRSVMEAEEQPESPSAIGMPAPGGPSAQMNLKLKGFSGDRFEEEHDGLLPLAPIHKEGALGAMELLPSLGQTAPSTQPYILVLKDAQMKTEASCQDDDNNTLGLAQEDKTGHSDPLRGIEPDPGSHWLDELLASPPPSADDTKRKSTSKSEDPTGPEDLLGWSRKDLSSEFGIVEASQPETFGMGWSDAPGIGKVEWPVETEQDREFGTGKRDWPSSYGIDDTNEQEMEFGTSQQNWTRGTPLLGNSNIGQEEWLTAYGSSCAGQQIGELDWSSRYGMDTAESQDRKPYVRKPGWPRLCNAVTTDLENREFAAEKTDWSSQYPVSPVEKTDWTSKCSPENVNCPATEITTTLSDESGKFSTASHQESQLNVMHSEGPDDCRIVEVTSQDTAFSAKQSGWPSESNPDSSANKGQIEFSAQKVEQPNEYNANIQESQISTKKQPRPNTYGFGDVSSRESELSFKQPDWHSKYDLEVAQCQVGEFSSEKPDETSEHSDSRTSWANELGIGNRDSTTECEASSLEFCAQKPVWTDEYRLSGPHSSDFPASTRDWAKDTDVLGTKREKPYGATGNDQAGTFGPLDLPGLKVTIDLVEAVDKTGDVRIVAMDEPRGIGEGQPDAAQDLGLGGMDLSSDLKFGSPDTSKKPTEKQPDWFPALGLESLPVSSAARSLNPEEFREPGVGQADLPYRSGIEGINVSDLQPKDLDASEELDPMQMDWTGKTGMAPKDFSYHYEAAGLIQHPEASKYSGESSSRDFHSQRLSSSSNLLDEMIANSAVKLLPQEGRPPSFQICLLEEEKGLNSLTDDQLSSTEKTGVSPLEEDEKVWPNGDGGLSQLDGANENQPLMEARVLSHPEQNGSQAARPMSQESTTEGAGVPPVENFIFLEDTEVLDSTMFRDRANVGRKRGHRAPVTRSGGALSESDRDSWMFKDSTEPRIASAVSDEETPEEPRSRKSRNSPLPKGVKVPLFPGLNPSALKAKLRGRNRSAEEGDTQGEVKQTSAKETHVQRSKSCKMANVSGKPLVLPPKPEKSSGSETSSPNWLQVLKLKKKKS